MLKQVVENWGAPSQATELPTYALDQVRWVIARFAGADRAGGWLPMMVNCKRISPSGS